MSRRLVLLASMVAVMALEVQAAGPLLRRRAIQRRSVPSKRMIPLEVLRSPEKMTQMFGPSILVREQPQAARTQAARTQAARTNPKKTGRFVSQPD